jgi:ABC-type branched-subunit amino acid transport system ATPase component
MAKGGLEMAGLLSGRQQQMLAWPATMRRPRLQNVGLSLKIADHVYVRESGRIVSSGPPAAFAGGGDLARYDPESRAAGRSDASDKTL